MNWILVVDILSICLAVLAIWAVVDIKNRDIDKKTKRVLLLTLWPFFGPYGLRSYLKLRKEHPAIAKEKPPQEPASKNDIIRWGITLALGMLVVLWRVVLPTNMAITVGVVALVVALDLIVTVAVIFLNKKELKAAFSKRFTLKDTGKTVFVIVADFIIVAVLVAFVTIGGVALPDLMANAPAALVASEFQEVFAIGAFISMVIFAPVWEEIVFRLAGKNLLKNGFLFVAVTACMFAFIHTANFSLGDNLFYLASGVIYAVAYLLFKDIRIVMIAHFLWNLFAGMGALLG